MIIKPFILLDQRHENRNQRQNNVKMTILRRRTDVDTMSFRHCVLTGKSSGIYVKAILRISIDQFSLFSVQIPHSRYIL